jgi:hypothetical protein
LGTGKAFLVEYRFDGQEPVSRLWNWGGLGDSAWVPAWDTESFLRQLLSSTRFVFRVTTDDGDQPTLIFDIPSDLRDYVDRLGCVTLD